MKTRNPSGMEKELILLIGAISHDILDTGGGICLHSAQSAGRKS